MKKAAAIGSCLFDFIRSDHILVAALRMSVCDRYTERNMGRVGYRPS